MEVICAILVALFGIGFGIFMALQPEDAIALHDRGDHGVVHQLAVLLHVAAVDVQDVVTGDHIALFLSPIHI